MIRSDFSSLVGNTPMLDASRFCEKENIGARILLKLEFFNPAGSVKDRVAVNMLKKAGIAVDGEIARFDGCVDSLCNTLNKKGGKVYGEK